MFSAENPPQRFRLSFTPPVRGNRQARAAEKNPGDIFFQSRRFARKARLKNLLAFTFLICLLGFLSPPVRGQNEQVRRAAEKLQSEGEELFNKNTPEARREAAPKFVEALRLWREIGDERRQIESLNKLVDISYYDGEIKKSLAFSEEILPLARKTGEKNLEGGVLGNIGWYYDMLGETRKGLGYLEKSAEILREVGDKKREGAALSGVGMLNYYLGEIQTALDFFNRSLVLRRETKDRRGETLVLINLGKAFDDAGDKRKAVEFYEQALKIAVEEKDSRTQSLVVNNLGSVWQDLGEYQKAFDAYQKSLELDRQNGDKPGEAARLNNLASLHRTLGDFESALELINRTLEINRKGNFRRDEARTLSSIGAIYAAMGDRAKALEFYRQSLEIQNSLENKEVRAVLLRNIGLIHFDRNEPEKALENFRQARQLAEEAGDAASHADVLVLSARAFERLNDSQSAEANFARALAIQREIGLQNDLPETLYHYAKFDERGKRRQAALAKMREAMETLENLRNSVGGQSLRSSYLAQQQKYFDFYINLLVSQHRLEPTQSFDRLALKTSESARARSLLESLGESQADVRADASAELAAREKILRQSVNAKESQRLAAVKQKSPEKVAALEKELSELVRQYRDLQTTIRRQSPRFAALTDPKILDSAQIQTAILDEKTVLLEYFLGAENSFLFVVTNDDLEIFDLPKRETIETAARGAINDLKERAREIAGETPPQRIERLKKADARTEENLVRLSEILLKPALARIQNKRLLIVAPEILQYVPFAALPIPQDKFQISSSKNEKSAVRNPAFGAKRLVESGEIVNLPSASVLAVLRQNRARLKNPKNLAAILADPVFTADDARLKTSAKQIRNSPGEDAAAATAIMRKARIVPPQFRSDFGRLRFSRLEAEAILEAASGDQKFVAMDFAANLQAANSEEFQKSRIVHLATHGVVNSDFPELSGVVLSLVDETGKPREGFLRLHDVYNLRLDADLVVLSACETALGKEIKGEGIVGLTRGFMYAGAPSVVASLWRVEDRATADLMRRFYRKMLRENLAPAAALRAAQISMISEKTSAHPFFWAGFTLQGDWK